MFQFSRTRFEVRTRGTVMLFPDWQFATQKRASLMRPPHLDASRKEASVVPGFFFYFILETAGGLERALLLPQCLFVSRESAKPHERLIDKAHIHTK